MFSGGFYKFGCGLYWLYINIGFSEYLYIYIVDILLLHVAI